MKKIFAACAAGLILASAVPVMAAENSARPGYCWQESDQSTDGWHCRGRGPHGHGGYCWDNNQSPRQ
ncbi:MAG: hypothetical protein IIZ16_00690 [Selenomonas sp.]|nr:hypothetical protein [Selenomonas sp.]